jgi:hypothetical protein
MLQSENGGQLAALASSAALLYASGRIRKARRKFRKVGCAEATRGQARRNLTWASRRLLGIVAG